MDRVDKFVRKLEAHEASRLIEAITCIRVGRSLDHFDIRKLQGDRNAYRVRIGRVRIQFTKTLVGNIITDVDFRNDNTY